MNSKVTTWGNYFCFTLKPAIQGKNYKPWKDGSLKKQPEIGVNENAGGEGNPQAKVRCTLCNNDISADNRCDQIKATNPRSTLNIVSIDLKLYSRTEIGHSSKTMTPSIRRSIRSVLYMRCKSLWRIGHRRVPILTRLRTCGQF